MFPPLSLVCFRQKPNQGERERERGEDSRFAGEQDAAAAMSTMKFCREWFVPLLVFFLGGGDLDLQSNNRMEPDPISISISATTFFTPRRRGTGAPSSSPAATASTRFPFRPSSLFRYLRIGPSPPARFFSSLFHPGDL
jgi:hypothetical protein